MHTKILWAAIGALTAIALVRYTHVLDKLADVA